LEGVRSDSDVKVLYGYRYPEVNLPAPVNIDLNSDIEVIKDVDINPEKRMPVARSLGLDVKGAVLPHVDVNDPQTVLMGLLKRLCVKHNLPEHKLLSEFNRFVKKFCKRFLTRLGPDDFLSVEAWLETTNYERWRKDELLALMHKMGNVFTKKSFTIGGFIKDEHYPDWKHARGINARSDEAKLFFGPIFKAIETQVFKLKYFIKKVRSVIELSSY